MLSIKHAVKIFSIIILFTLASRTFAVNFDYSVEASLVRYDNINRRPVPVGEEWAQLISGELNFTENTTNVISKINTQITSISYRNNQQNDETIGKLSASVLWIITPRHFEWLVEDIYTQILINPFDNNIQSNRQNVNAFLTGPNYYWRLNSRHNIDFEIRYASVRFEDKVGNNERQLSAVRWVYEVNSSVTASLNSELEKIDFEEDTRDDLLRSDIFAAIDYVRGRNTIKAEAGTTNIDYDLQPSVSLPRYKLSIQNQRTRTSSIRLEYSEKITDAGRNLVATIPRDNNDQDIPISSVADIFKDERVGLIYNKELNSGNFKVLFAKNKQIYDQQPTLDRNRDIITVRISHYFNRVSLIELEGVQSEIEYFRSTPQRNDVDNYYKVSYTYTSSRNLRLILSAESFERESTDPTKAFEDKKILFSIKYFSR